MVVETALRPRLPYSLTQSARASADATRRFRDGVLTVLFEAAGSPAVARVRQCREGTLAVRVEAPEPDAALEHLRFMLSLDDDHTPFLQRFARDPLLGEATRRLQGLRPLRLATVPHALLTALCGQLVQARAARLLEARLLRAHSRPHAGLHLPPDRSTFARLAPADLVGQGLGARKAATLVRLSRELDLERLRTLATDLAAKRIEGERGLGPWSAGVICLYGLGRFDRGLVGDLGLIKLCAALYGRWADADDTRELLDPYGEWAGLASVYLLAGAAPALTNARGRRTPLAPPARRSPDPRAGSRRRAGATSHWDEPRWPPGRSGT